MEVQRLTRTDYLCVTCYRLFLSCETCKILRGVNKQLRQQKEEKLLTDHPIISYLVVLYVSYNIGKAIGKTIRLWREEEED